jgi:hypothetical protein
MSVRIKLTAKDVALIICFTALYAVFASIPIFQILGVPSRSITAAAITAPIIGVFLGPYVGTLSATLGGVISFFVGSFFPPSFFSGIFATLCAGLLSKGKRMLCILVYILLLFAFGFYPSIGPAWLFPLSLWFQVVGLLILVMPIQPVDEKNLKSDRNSRLLLALFIVSLTSTLAGQISGSLAYVILGFPPILGGWTAQWQSLTFLYPAERIIIALGSALIGAPLVRVLKSSNLVLTLDHDSV